MLLFLKYEPVCYALTKKNANFDPWNGRTVVRHFVLTYSFMK